MQVHILSPKPRIIKSSILFIPLLLSAFTHLWNPIGFPFFEQDEGHYMRRAMQVLEGLGPQESISTYVFAYDHPYFGQLFLASILKVIGYPDLLQPKVGDIHSIEMLYFIPRVLMGVLAVVDTFLVYKIAETRYNRKVAFIAATLFAVMPLSWILRRIWLDSIQLPFLLLSILFAAYYAKKSERHCNDSSGYNERNKKIILLLLSGIFLGLAIFTKTPAFTMIPLILFVIIRKKKGNKKIGYDSSYDDNNNSNYNKTDHHNKIIRYDNNGKNLKARISSLKPLGIWFVPVILIPLIWPLYSISQGQLDGWLDGILWQATRADRPFPPEIQNAFTRLDPIIIGLAAAGLIYAIIRSDYFILLWSFPLLVFLYLVNWVYFFHLIPLFPAFCIIIATLLEDLIRNISKKRSQRLLEFAVFAAIIIFGFINTSLLITTNLNSSYFNLVSYISRHLPGQNSDDNGYNSFNNYNGYKNGNNYGNNTVTLVGPNGGWSFFWLVKYVFDRDVDYKWFEENRDYVQGPLKSKKFLLIVDREMRYLFSIDTPKQHINYASRLYDNSTLFDTFKISTHLPDLKKYPFTNVLDDVYKDVAKARGLDWGNRIDIRGNY